MAPRPRTVLVPALSAALALVACGSSSSGAAQPQAGAPIGRAEGTPIDGAPGWTWVPFPDSVCTDAVPDATGRYRFGTSTTGLAISWGPSASGDLVLILQGGGACFDFFTCGGAAPVLDKTATAGPYGPAQFATDPYGKYPSSWIHRENLPASLSGATLVFIPYCTGDVHGGDRVTTYSSLLPGVPDVTWHHVGHSNVMAFLRRLVATFPSPGTLIVAGSSGGGFGALANYETFRNAWPSAVAYLVDDSGPPLVGDDIPPTTRAAWYASWDLGASLDPFCPECRADLSAVLRAIAVRYPKDRVGLSEHLQDAVIRAFFGSIVLTPAPTLEPMPAAQFEAALHRLGSVMDPATATQKYFYTSGTGHPMLDNPAAIATPPPGYAPWLELMLSGAPGWASASD